MGLHKTKSISFTLVVDDFAVQYLDKQNAHNLRYALLVSYEIATDWGRTVYSGMTLKWDCQKGTCDISTSGYVANVLNKFQHENPKYPQHTPSKYVTPVYDTNTQSATRDETPPLSTKHLTKIQNFTVSVLYYSRKVDPTVIMPLN
jgi:hypothetical protein